MVLSIKTYILDGFVGVESGWYLDSASCLDP